MGHFRRMDPQPERNVAVVAGSQLLTWWAGEPPAVLSAPVDMPNAYPWQDRDGEWYWRRATHANR